MSLLFLIINSGSSSVKFQLFSHTKKLDLLAQGKVYNLGTGPEFQAKDEETKFHDVLQSNCTHEEAIQHILHWIKQQHADAALNAVVHRVVHGADVFSKSVVVTPDIIEQLKQFNCFAPLHQPHNIAGIEIIQQLMPDMLQIACFDTAFHAHHKALFNTYALPNTLREQGIRRYGFHGLSYEWSAYRLKQDHPELAKGRVVVAHLGNGASLCALNHCKSIDTTMGLTALDGLPMGTRCGSLDPGAVLYLIKDLKYTPEEVEHILYNQSGLLALSRQTNDVKQLEESKTPQSQFALDYFCLKTAQYISMMAVSLGGIDGLVFTGGIGENSAFIREKIRTHLGFLKPFTVLIIPANEEFMMALHALALSKTMGF